MAEIPVATKEFTTGVYELPENQDRRYQSIDFNLVNGFPKVYIFSVDPVHHVVSKGGLGDFVVPAKPAGEKVSEALIIKGMHPEHMHLGTEISPVNYVNGMQLAEDIVGVNSQDKGIGRHTSNLEWHGVFISQNEKPTAKEIQAAVEKRRLYNLQLVADADGKYMSGRTNLIDACERAAAHEENLKKAWAEKPTSMDACPACGSAVMANIAVCPNCTAVLREDLARVYFPERFAKASPADEQKTAHQNKPANRV